MTNRNSGKKSTFWFTTLDSKDRLRYPFVSLFFDMCSTLWNRRGVWENLFDIEFAEGKVGSRAQNLHGSNVLNMENFGRNPRFRRARPKNSALPGAARCALASPQHGTWLVETVLLNRQSNTLLGPGRRSSKRDEQKIREKIDVLLHCSGVWKSFATSARQFVL